MDKGRDADVVVVGAGGAGVAAAIDAHDAGASVIIVDSHHEPGGATAISGGGCCMVGTAFQREKGIEDNPNLAFSDWVHFGQGSADEQWARFYIEHSAHDLYEWLTAMGVVWDSFNHQEGNTVPRWHHPVGNGKAIFEAMQTAARARGIDQWLMGTEAIALLEDDERVTGVRVRDRKTGEERDLTAGAVVMASGGFMSNVEMVYQYRPDLRHHRILGGSHVEATGRGHKLVTEAGGTLTHMGDVWMYAYATPDYRDPEGERGLVVRGLPDYVWVNAQGQRFHNEGLSGGASATPAVLAQDPAYCWAIIDQTGRETVEISDPYYRDGLIKHWDRIDDLFQKSPNIKESGTLRGLALETGMPGAALEETITRYNAYIDEGLQRDPDFGRPLQGRKKVEQAPFYALQFFPLSRKSFGGVKTDLRCQVMDSHFQPIEGLFGAGELAGMAGGHINGKAGLEGTMLGPALFSGRVAGSWAANAAGFGPGFVGTPLR